jgi:putative transposase
MAQRRIFAEGVPAHLIVRGNDRRDVFVTDGDRIYFHRSLAELAGLHGVAVHAYVLMSNHVHLLATALRPSSIPRTMQALGRRYVRYFNDLHGRTGTLWEGRYKSAPVESDRYFLTCQRYIELNPVRAGMVAGPGEHAWSSFRRHAWERPDDLVSPHSLYVEMGANPASRREAYSGLFSEDLDEVTLYRIRQSIQRGWPLGSDEFCKRLEKETGIRTAPLPVGRRARKLDSEPD